MAAHLALGAFRLFAGLERDKFDNKTVTFEEHIKEEHNMWHYLCFIVLVKVKDSTEYTGPESYVAEMIQVRGGLRGGAPVPGPARSQRGVTRQEGNLGGSLGLYCDRRQTLTLCVCVPK